MTRYLSSSVCLPSTRTSRNAGGSSIDTSGIINQAAIAFNGSWCPDWASDDGQGRLTYLTGIGAWEQGFRSADNDDKQINF